MLYPQNGERIVTLDSVTSLRRMHSYTAANHVVTNERVVTRRLTGSNRCRSVQISSVCVP